MNGRLEVVFKDVETDAILGYGFHMPSKEFFNNTYVLERFPDAINLGDGKYQIGEGRYIVCE